jgi:hypothetical protein
MVVPGMTKGPKQITGDRTPGHSSPQSNGCGCRTMRAIGSPSGAMTLWTAAIAGGQGSMTMEAVAVISGTHTTVSPVGSRSAAV